MESKIDQIIARDYDASNLGEILTSNELNLSRGWLLGFCTEGGLSITVDRSSHAMKKNSILAIIPGQRITDVNYSSDVKLKCIYVPTDIMALRSSHDYEREIRKKFLNSVDLKQLFGLIHYDGDIPSPEVNMSDIHTEECRCLFNILKQRTSRKGNHNLVLELLLVESIVSCMAESLPVVSKQPVVTSRTELIAKRFFARLVNDVVEHHDVGYYAEKENITPKYLSMVIRNETGHPAIYWIESMLVFKAKQLLRSTALSSSQIAAELNFSDAAVFSRFFKRYTDFTPIGFRRSTRQ